MENTVRPGTTMLVEKGQGIRRGDVIALTRPGEPSIRRVIGLPGDRVACCAAGHVTVIGRVVAVLGGGVPQLLLHTPQAFVTAGLAPADQRTP